VRSVDDHLARIVATVAPLAPLDLQILDAAGCILAEDVVAATDLPPFENSAMDGYAVRVGDVAAASETAPVRLPVVGDIAAGNASAYTVQPGLHTRIMTGAPVPTVRRPSSQSSGPTAGIATVAIQPARRAGSARPPPAGRSVRVGDVVLAGRHAARRDPRRSAGRARPRPRDRPPTPRRVVVLSDRSELARAGHGIGPGQISESNSYLLTVAAKDAGAQGYRVGYRPRRPQDDRGRDRGPAHPRRSRLVTRAV
jgi:molybdopterin molybdotransferase